MFHGLKTFKLVTETGFNQLELAARGALVREGMYASMLLLLARDYEPTTGKCNYFDFSAEERNVILRYFPPFTRIIDHLSITGRLYQELALTLPEFTLVCAIEILKNFAVLSGASGTHARRFFLLAKHSLLATMQNHPSTREFVEKRCAQLESFSQVLHDLSMEHRDLLFALKVSDQPMIDYIFYAYLIADSNMNECEGSRSRYLHG
ncbi:unnamed protein product [Dibothriocephalus latus]|uniref:NR LBD domain-containing protein n=1 Tax=Dibothriocephalus latus TaxID=60516 RepID=A0A3P7QLQ5_DIBLA|nr:unnamed protein product [Dibothriocephalus latus]